MNRISYLISERARGSIGRDRMLSGVVSISAQPPPSGHQEDLNNELLAVSNLTLNVIRN